MNQALASRYESLALMQKAWTQDRFSFEGKYFKLPEVALRPKPVQPHPPLWRSVISPGSFTECGKLGIPILTARLPVLARLGIRG